MISLLPQDLHCHILPGVDDGFKNAADSLNALKLMAAEGCRDIVFTPHLNPDVYPDSSEEMLREAYDGFVAGIPADLGIKTHLAAEYMVVKDFESRIEDTSKLLTFEDGRILIEMSYYYGSDNLQDVVFQLNMAGLKPILAHPERYVYLVDKMRAFRKLKDMGCLFQMNYMSLSGAYGPDSIKILTTLLEEGWYDYICTDLHTTAQLDRIHNVDPGRKLTSLLSREFPDLKVETKAKRWWIF